MQTIKLYEALKRMRELTEASIPFSIEFVGCNLTKGCSDGHKKIDRAFLRTGFSAEKSSKSHLLIGYYIADTNEPRWFYLPLLLKFNGIPIKP